MNFARNPLTWNEIHLAKRWGTCGEPMMARWAKRSLKSGQSVIDLGCGVGANSFWLSSEGFIVSAVDVSSAAIERMKDRAHCHLPIPHGRKQAIDSWVGDLTSLNWSDQSFDAAVDVASLQHVVGPKYINTALREVHRVLKPGGLFFSMTASDRHDRGLLSGMPARLMTQSQAVALYRSAGFEILNVESCEHSDHGSTVAHLCLECRKITI